MLERIKKLFHRCEKPYVYNHRFGEVWVCSYCQKRWKVDVFVFPAYGPSDRTDPGDSALGWVRIYRKV